MKMEQTLPVLMALAENRGIRVKIVPFKAHNGFWRVKDGVETIFLGEHLNMDPEKKAFIFAHELGHAVLHSDRKNFDMALYWENNMDNEYARSKESEADIFAKGLLLGSGIGMKFGA